MPEIVFDHVDLTVPGRDILSDVSLRITEHRVGIIGANGSGKSSLTRLINGLNDATSGTVTVDGLDVANNGTAVRKKIGFVFSDAENQIIMPRVIDDVAFSLRRLKIPTADRQEQARAALRRFGLAEHEEDSPHTLSGGQKQLLALAAVWVMHPEIIIADEPTTLLDRRNRAKLLAEFARLEQQLIVVTHDLEILKDFDRVICLHDGRVAADGTPPDVIDFYCNLIDSEAT